MKPSYVLTFLLASFLPMAYAVSSHHDERLALSTFFKPLGQDKKRLGISSLSYTFSGATADTINMIRLCNATDATCSTCNTNFTIITAGTPIPYTTSGTSYGISATSVAAYLATQGLPAGSYNIGMYVQSTTANCSGSDCCTNNDNAGMPHALCIQATYSGGAVTALAQSDNGSAVLNTPAPETQLSATLNILALAVSGQPRTITITNLGLTAASGVTYTPSPGLPSGATIVPASCGTISASGGTCVLTITPGATPSAGAYDISPTPITLTIAGSNTNTLNPTTDILTYGSVYQKGYVFSIDDTTATTRSIGGKVIALTDQAAASPNGTVWSSDGTGPTNVSHDTIPGIDENSTVGSPSPALNPPPILTGCNGATDGACDSNNIVSYYNYYRTGGGTPPTPLTDYSAGLCANYSIDSLGNTPCVSGNTCYTGWYLPSICEMGPDSGNSICSTATVEQNIVDKLSSLLGDGSSCTAGTGCVYGYYWSSTENLRSSQHAAWSEHFASSGGSFQIGANKFNTLGARCSRAF